MNHQDIAIAKNNVIIEQLRMAREELAQDNDEAERLEAQREHSARLTAIMEDNKRRYANKARVVNNLADGTVCLFAGNKRIL